MARVPARAALRWALEIETNGEAFYRAVASKASTHDVKLLFEDLAYQEQRHHRTFERMLSKLPDDEPADAPLDDYASYMRTALNNALAGGPDRGLALAEQAGTEEEALQAAMAFEKDTIIFFDDIREMVSVAERDVVEAIIREEKGHLRQIARVLEAGPWVS